MKDLINKTVEELHKELNDSRVSLHKLRFSNSTKTNNVKENSKIKKQIARIKTILASK